MTIFQDNSKIEKCSKSRKSSVYMMLLLFIFSTAFSFAVGVDQRNYLLIGIMQVSCILFLFTFKSFRTEEIYIYFFYLSLLLCLIQHPESFRPSTISYTLMFVLTFVVYLRLLHSHALYYHKYKKILKLIIYAYFFVLVIQQLCVLTGVPIFNFILGEGTEFKLNSLSPEPSHSARIVTILFFSFICMREIVLERPYNILKDSFFDRYIWFCFLYVMLTMGSGTAFFLLGLLFIRFVSVRNFKLVLGSALIIYIASPFLRLDIRPLKRVIDFGGAFLTGPPEQLAIVDHSASIRVLPVYYYIEQIQVYSANFWFGAGFDFNKKLFPMLIPGIPEGISVGGLFSTMLLNHGILAGILFFLMFYKNCLNKFWSYQNFIGIVIIFACGINTQLTWLVFILLSTNLFFKKNVKVRHKI